eukprot:1509212-Prymnesium_polylepis.1
MTSPARDTRTSCAKSEMCVACAHRERMAMGRVPALGAAAAPVTVAAAPPCHRFPPGRRPPPGAHRGRGGPGEVSGEG